MQTKLMSFIETSLNVGSGFIISVFMWQYVVAPLWEIERTFTQGIGITLVFTVTSVIRGFIWRRIFNNATDRR